MSFLSCNQLKEAVYQFLDSAIIYTPALLNVILEPLLEYSVNDLRTVSQRNVLIKIIVLWESLVTKDLFSLDSDFVAKIIPQLLPPLINVMQSVNTSQVLDYTEWEPYTAAYSCIQCIAKSHPNAVLPLLAEYTMAACQSENWFDREGAIKSLRITFQVADKESLGQIASKSLELILQHILDPAPRVRAAVVDCLIVAISRLNTTWKLFSPFMQPLLQIGITDCEPTEKQAFEAIRLIAKFDDFDQYGQLFESIVTAINLIPPTVTPSAIDCLSLPAHAENVDKAIIFSCFQFLTNLLAHVLKESRNYAILDMVCKVLSTVIVNSDSRIAPYAERLCSCMYTCFKDLSISNALTVVASLCVPAQEFIQKQVPVFMPLVMEAQCRYCDPGILIPAIRLVPLVVNRLDLGDFFFQRLMDNMFTSLKMGETAPAKSEILHVFCILLTKKTEMFRPFITKLFCAMLYLVTYLENVYRIYLEYTAQLVSNICQLCVAMFQVVSRDDQLHVFNLCIQMINTIVKMPKLLYQINEELVDVILCLLQNFRDETLQQIQQIPSITEILRSGLKLVQRSDAEIEQLMSVLMNSVQNS